MSYIKNYYKKADYFLEIYSAIEKLYQEYQSDDACSFIISTMIQSFIFFDIKVEIKKASDYVFNEKKGELVLEICKYFGADIYVSGQGAKSYMDYAMLDKFTESGIKIEWQTFIHPGYYQGSELLKFVEGLSCLDILFHNGIEKSREIFNLSLFRCAE